MTLAEDRWEIAEQGDLATFSERWRAHLDRWLATRFAAVAPEGDGLALVAVGGYGYGRLAPGSDLDLLLLHRGRAAPIEVADALWYPIWDEGLALGHAVRSRRETLELAEDDLDTATALLSCRHLAGDAASTAGLAEAAVERWRRRGPAVLDRLDASCQDRWARDGEVAFLLEPDLKVGRGGLRDLDALRWAEVARPLVERADVAPLRAAEEALGRARTALHVATRRPGNRLDLGAQDDAAGLLGLDADGLMAGVAEAARRVAWIADDCWTRARLDRRGGRGVLGWRSRSQAPGVVVRAGQVELEHDVDPARRPELVFVAAAVACRTGARFARSTLDRLAARTPAPTEPWDADLRARFVGLLLAGHPAIGVVEALDHVGLWTRYLPEWDEVRSHPQRNAYHRFTVDRHLLETVAGAAALAERVDRPDLLVLGALFHDLAKARPGDHCEVGVDLAGEALARMGVAAEDRATVAWLVRHHLLLAEVATRRDVTEPATVAVVAEQVGDRGRLALLAALTEADSVATGPAAWSPWKAGLLAELVRRVDHHLAGGDPAALASSRFPDEALRDRAAAGRTGVEVEEERVTVVAAERAGLLERITGVLAIEGLSVLAADAASVAGHAVARFRVAPMPGVVVDRERTAARIDAALAGRLAIEARLAARARSPLARDRAVAVAGGVVVDVRFDDAASPTATVVEVRAPDSAGLLHRLVRAVGELDLAVRTLKAQTSAGVAIDAFYLHDRDGEPVTDEARRRELDLALRHAAS